MFFTFRLERLDHLAQKFKHKCDIHEEWSHGKESMLQAQDFKQCRLNELKVIYSSLFMYGNRRIHYLHISGHIPVIRKA